MLEGPDPCAVHPSCRVGAVGRRQDQRPAARAGGVEELELLVLDPAALGAAALRGVLDLGRLVDAFRAGTREGCRLAGGVLFLLNKNLPAAVCLPLPASRPCCLCLRCAWSCSLDGGHSCGMDLMGRLAVAVAELVWPALPRLELRPVPVGELGLVGGGLGR